MLPPISPAVLEQNPKFKALYKDLTTNKLNPDGTTKDLKKQRIMEELEKKLFKARTNAAEKSILIDSLYNMSLSVTDLPLELREVTQIICADLSTTIPAEDHEILTDDISFFLSHLQDILTPLSTHLTTQTTHLTRIAHPSTPATNLPSLIPSLPTHITSLQRQNDYTLHTIAEKSHALTTLLSTHLSTHLTLLTHLIRTHDLILHGSLARHTRAHAEHLASVAQGMSLKLSVQSHPKTLGADTELAGALSEYARALAKKKSELTARKTGAERRVREYEREGRGVREMAGKWVELKAEEGKLREEIERLEEGV